MKTKAMILAFVFTVLLVLGFIPMASASTEATQTVIEATPTIQVANLVLTQQQDLKKYQAEADRYHKAYDKTLNQLGPLFKNVLIKRSRVIRKLKKARDFAVSQDPSALSIAHADIFYYSHARKAILKAFSNDGHAHLTSYNDGTRAFGDVARDGAYRGSYIFLPGIGFFHATDVGGAVHGRPRADVYTPWAAEPCNNALGVYHAGGPSFYEFNPKALGIKMNGFMSAKRRYEQPRSVRANHAKYGVFKK